MNSMKALKTSTEVGREQAHAHEKLLAAAQAYVASLPMDGLDAVLLSGSLARGDYWPGEMGGMVDLVFFRSRGSDLKPETLLGPDLEPDIPYHCTLWNSVQFSSAWLDLPDRDGFLALDEARKFALLESKVLWERGSAWTGFLASMEGTIWEDLAKMREGCLGYAGYLLNPYKEDRWMRREAWLQLHDNLDTALGMVLRAVYHLNGSYAPAEDRRWYYSLNLPSLPEGWAQVWPLIRSRDGGSREDYLRRRALYRERIEAFFRET